MGSLHHREVLDDQHLRQGVKIRRGLEHRVLGGAGVVQLDLLHGADDQTRGQEAAQAGGDDQVAVEQLAVGGRGS